jgi:hypothetical protein
LIIGLIDFLISWILLLNLVKFDSLIIGLIDFLISWILLLNLVKFDSLIIGLIDFLIYWLLFSDSTSIIFKFSTITSSSSLDLFFLFFMLELYKRGSLDTAGQLFYAT